jgi:hypothetical protein
MRKNIKIFISYAHANQDLASRFVSKFKEYTRPSKTYYYQYWRDTDLLVGEDWDQEIKTALDECHLGMLLISASFLGSSYITRVELKAIKNKPVLPVLLWPIDFERHDLKGLERYQFFRLQKPGLIRPKAYGECTTKQREEFIFLLFQQVEASLDKLFFS